MDLGTQNDDVEAAWFPCGGLIRSASEQRSDIRCPDACRRSADARVAALPPIVLELFHAALPALQGRCTQAGLGSSFPGSNPI